MQAVNNDLFQEHLSWIPVCAYLSLRANDDVRSSRSILKYPVPLIPRHRPSLPPLRAALPLPLRRKPLLRIQRYQRITLPEVIRKIAILLNRYVLQTSVVVLHGNLFEVCLQARPDEQNNRARLENIFHWPTRTL